MEDIEEVLDLQEYIQSSGRTSKDLSQNSPIIQKSVSFKAGLKHSEDNSTKASKINLDSKIGKSQSAFRFNNYESQKKMTRDMIKEKTKSKNRAQSANLSPK